MEQYFHLLIMTMRINKSIPRSQRLLFTYINYATFYLNHISSLFQTLARSSICRDRPCTLKRNICYKLVSVFSNYYWCINIVGLCNHVGRFKLWFYWASNNMIKYIRVFYELTVCRWWRTSAQSVLFITIFYHAINRSIKHTIWMMCYFSKLVKNPNIITVERISIIY